MPNSGQVGAPLTNFMNFARASVTENPFASEKSILSSHSFSLSRKSIGGGTRSQFGRRCIIRGPISSASSVCAIATSPPKNRAGPHQAGHGRVVHVRVGRIGNRRLVQPVPSNDGSHGVEIFVVETGNDLRHGGCAAGKLEQRDLEGVVRDSPQPLPRFARVFGSDHVREGYRAVRQGSAVRPRGDGKVERRDLLAHLPGKGDEVEPPVAPVEEVSPRLRVPAEIADLVLAMRGERANRNQAGFQACDDGNDEIGRVLKLEQHPIQRIEAEAQEGGGGLVGQDVQPGERDRPVYLGNRDPVRKSPDDIPERRNEGFVRQYACLGISSEAILRKVDDAGNRLSDSDFLHQTFPDFQRRGGGPDASIAGCCAPGRGAVRVLGLKTVRGVN